MFCITYCGAMRAAAEVASDHYAFSRSTPSLNSHEGPDAIFLSFHAGLLCIEFMSGCCSSAHGSQRCQTCAVLCAIAEGVWCVLRFGAQSGYSSR